MAESGRKLSLAGRLGNLFPRSLPPRLLLIFFAVFIQICGDVFSWYAVNTKNPAIIFFSVVLWLVWFVFVFLITRPWVDERLNPYRKVIHLAAVVLIVVLVLMLIGEAVGLQLVNRGVLDKSELAENLADSVSYNDATALTHQASSNLLKGEDPYSNSNIVKAVQEFHVPTTYLTPLRQGDFVDVFPYPTKDQINAAFNKSEASPDTIPLEFESKISYPAGSFILQAPFVAMGLKDTRVFYLLCALAMVVVVYWKAPKRLRSLVIVAFLTNLVFWNLIGTGSTDTLYALLILLGWILRRRIWLSALFIGLAATTKQTAWFFILFYLVLLLRDVGWKRALQSVGIIAAIFIVFNLTFIFNAPKDWVQGVMAPILDPMFPKGVGLVAFSVAGVLPSNSLPFSIIEVAVLVSALTWYYFNCRKYPQAGLLLAVLPLFFAWRSFSCYFYFASLLIFGAIVVEEYNKFRTGAQPQVSAVDNIGT
jgi:hypothetical protein